MGEQNIVFYANDGHVAGINTIQVYKTLTAMVRMFERVILHMDLGKMKAILCSPRFIRGHRGEAEYNRREKGKDSTLIDRKRTRVICIQPCLIVARAPTVGSFWVSSCKLLFVFGLM